MTIERMAMDADRIPELSVVMPCLNEENSLGRCIEQILETFAANNISGKIIVADNGSVDRSVKIAQSRGATVVSASIKGYGSALRTGIAAASSKYVIMGDADGTYDFSQIPTFLQKLRSGYELVIGNRFSGEIKTGAMRPLHQYFGNPVLSGVGRLFFKTPFHDFHCGLRGFSISAYERLGMRTTGMEFASEMVVKASLCGLRACEVPTTLSPDQRPGRSHLRSWHDGWRHLRFLLLYSPRWLFLYPGLALLLTGLAITVWLLPGPRRVGHVFLDVHTLLYSVAAILCGFQIMLFAIFTKIFAVTEGLLPADERLNSVFRFLNLERGLCVGAVLLVTGVGIALHSLWLWNQTGFGPMNPVVLVRLVAAAILALTLGVEVIFASFFLSILGLARE